MTEFSCNVRRMIYSKNGALYTSGFKLDCKALADNKPLVSSKTDMHLALPLLRPALNSHLSRAHQPALNRPSGCPYAQDTADDDNNYIEEATVAVLPENMFDAFYALLNKKTKYNSKTKKCSPKPNRKNKNKTKRK